MYFTEVLLFLNLLIILGLFNINLEKRRNKSVITKSNEIMNTTLRRTTLIFSNIKFLFFILLSNATALKFNRILH